MNPNIEEIRRINFWNFEPLKYNISNESNDILLDNAYDPDLNFFSKNVKNLDTVYVLPEDFHDSLEKTVTSYFSVFHLYIRSMKKNFESFKTFLSPLDFTFSIIRFSETWCDDSDNLIYQIMQVAIKNGVIAKVGECLSTFIILSTSKLDLTFLPAVEILNHLYLRKYVSVLYRQPNSHLENFENFLTNFFLKYKKL